MCIYMYNQISLSVHVDVLLDWSYILPHMSNVAINMGVKTHWFDYWI